MEERLGEMRKGRRERMRKGAIVSSSPQGMTSWSSSIKIWFFKLIECIIKMYGVKQNAKYVPLVNRKQNEVFSYLRRTNN